MNNKIIYNKDNIILNYENKYITIKYKNILNIFKSKYLINIDNSLNETLLYKDYETINNTLNVFDNNNIFNDYLKGIILNLKNKFSIFKDTILDIYIVVINIEKFNNKYDTYINKVIDLNNINYLDINIIKDEIATLLNDMNVIDEEILNKLEIINNKYNEVININNDIEVSKNNSNIFEVNLSKIKEYINLISNIISNLEEFKIIVKEDSEYILSTDIKLILVDNIEILIRDINTLNNFINKFINQQDNNEDNIIYYLETNSRGFINNINNLIKK
jgi:hypothetical protein